MCGISAVIARDEIKRPVLQDPIYFQTLTKALDESLSSIGYRGPDTGDQWISNDNRVGTYQSLLAITSQKSNKILI